MNKLTQKSSRRFLPHKICYKNEQAYAEELEAFLATQDLLQFDGEVNFDDYLQDKESGLCTVLDIFQNCLLVCIACWCTVYHIFHK